MKNITKYTAGVAELFNWMDSHEGRSPSNMSSDRNERRLHSLLTNRRRCKVETPHDPAIKALDEMAASAGYPGYFNRLRCNGSRVRISGTDIKDNNTRAAKLATLACEFCDKHMRIPSQNSLQHDEKILGRWIQNTKMMFRCGIANQAGISVLKRSNKMWLVTAPVRHRSRSKLKFTDRIAAVQ